MSSNVTNDEQDFREAKPCTPRRNAEPHRSAGRSRTRQNRGVSPIPPTPVDVSQRRLRNAARGDEQVESRSTSRSRKATGSSFTIPSGTERLQF